MNTFVSLHGEIFKSMHKYSYEIAKQIVSLYIIYTSDVDPDPDPHESAGF